MGAGITAAINTLSVSDLNEGTRTMVGGLLPALREVAPEIRQLLVCSRANRHLFDAESEVVEVELDHRRVLRRVVHDQWSVPRLVRGRADVLVNAAGVGPLLTSIPQVSIVSHHFALPTNRDAAGADGPPRSRQLYYGAPFKLAMRRSAVVLGISEYLARGLVEELGVDPRKVVAMPLGVAPPPRRPTVEHRDPILLFVGTIYAYKDVATAIAGFARAQAALPPGARLVVVGKDPDGMQAPRLEALARHAGVADAVDVLGAIGADELERLYEKAAALVMPSRYEGFGLPVAEAMSRGMPVIVADTTSLPEVAGSAGLVVPAGDADAFATAMARLLGDEDLRCRLGRMALVRAQGMTWQASATILADAIRRSVRADQPVRGS